MLAVYQLRLHAATLSLTHPQPPTILKLRCEMKKLYLAITAVLLSLVCAHAQSKEEKKLRQACMEPVRVAIGLFEKVSHGQALTTAEIDLLESQFTADGFANIPGGFSYTNNTPMALSDVGIDPAGKNSREVFVVYMEKVVAEVRADNGKTKTKSERWVVLTKRSGKTIKSQRSGGNSEEKTDRELGLRDDDRVVITNDPQGDDEEYLFVVRQERGRWKIQRLMLVG